MEDIFRHGDMVIFRVAKPEVTDATNTKVAIETKLAVGLGEVTGHSHEVIALDDSKIIIAGYDSAEVKELAISNNLSFEIKGTAVIMHEEHGPIILEEGYYIRTVQRQYNPFTKTLEKIKD